MSIFLKHKEIAEGAELMGLRIKKAIVLAAGRGSRMRPLTDDRPKPLVEVGGRSLIDRAIDRLEAAGVEEVVVNLHYMADMLEAHLSKRIRPKILFSDERDVLLETGGGVRRALPLLGEAPFFVVNSDALWIDTPGGKDNLEAMMEAYEKAGSGYMMLVTEREGSVGYTGRGDFNMDAAGHLSWREENCDAPIMFAGVQIMRAAHFQDARDEAFSNKWVWDHALIPDNAFVGHRLEGRWLHASSAEDVAEIGIILEAEEAAKGRQ
jgi:N-acetyl-alpha-D-muramate 1-phosphate uridylyltransferase